MALTMREVCDRLFFVKLVLCLGVWELVIPILIFEYPGCWFKIKILKKEKLTPKLALDLDPESGIVLWL
jgi:hypothetical protein